MIAAGGLQLLDWLERYTFPAEREFGDPAHAREVADFFLAELLRNGTTTALVFATVHPQSVDAFFEAAQALGARMIAGKVLMDRHCPPYLRDTAESGYADSQALIGRWHGTRSPFVRRHAPLRADVDRAPARARGPPARRASGRVPAHARRRESRRGRVGGGALSRPAQLPRRLRRLRPRAAAVRVRALPASRRGRPRADGRRRRGDGLLPDVEPLPRERPLRPRGRAPASRARRARHRHRRRHELLDAAHAGRGLQGVAARRPAVGADGQRGTWRRSAARARCTSTIASATSGPGRKRISWCSIPRQRRCSRAGCVSRRRCPRVYSCWRRSATTAQWPPPT